MAIPAGLEPATLCLEGRCSIQLSYGTIGLAVGRQPAQGAFVRPRYGKGGAKARKVGSGHAACAGSEAPDRGLWIHGSCRHIKTMV